MSTDNTKPNWTARVVALSAMAALLVGALGSLDLTNRDAKSPAADTKSASVVATSCSGFEADAHKLLDRAGAVALTGTFAPGDHVRLAIDFNGAGYSWDSSGVLGTEPKVTRHGWFGWYKYDMDSTTTFTPVSESAPASSSTASHGKISGYARLEVDIEVTRPGDGAITLGKLGSEPSFRSAKVASASCTASGTKSLQPMM